MEASHHIPFSEFREQSGKVRSPYRELEAWLSELDPNLLTSRKEQAELLFRRIGITFSVENTEEQIERLIPFDIIPRIISRAEWCHLERGLIQRVRALNMFLKDVYGPCDVIRAGIIPAEMIYQSAGYSPEMYGRTIPHDIYVHITGVDVIRTSEHDFYVLEDNARTPSGVSYMLENREIMMRLFPDIFARHRVAPIDDYPNELLSSFRSVSPLRASRDPVIVLLTPGQYNSAFYEHSFLADKLGIELVEGRDLFVRDDVVFMRTTEGPQRIDVIYRRIDDDYLDPLTFRSDSQVGVAGLMGAYHAGNITLANAVGAGVADDKAVYTYIPDLIRFFLGEKPLLKNVPTYRCRHPESLKYVVNHIEELVIKEVNGSGGYGMLVGPHATRAEIEFFRNKLKAHPDKFIAQPTLDLSTCPIFLEKGLSERHVDLRPFVLHSANDIRVIPGGLTRVAMKENNLVVNSSQGGGTKDTWIISD